MAVGNLWTLSAIQITGSSPLLITGIDSSNFSNNIEELLESAAGQPNPSFVANMQIAPTLQFVSKQIAGILGLVSIGSGLCIPNGSTQTTVVAYFARVNKCADRSASSNHVSLTFANGLFVINSISASQGQAATIDVMFHALFDGTNVPVVVATTAGLPASNRVAEVFTLGPCKINGTDIGDVQSATVAINPTVEKLGGSGDLYPTFAGYMSKQVRFELECLDATHLSTYGPFSLATTSSSTLIYLRKMSNQASRVADATTQHISLALAGNSASGMVRVESLQAQNNQRAGVRLVVTPIENSTGYVVVNAATGIS
ncbi:MAG: hypothetical protein EB060_08680 [Proteobacteria bacterium]|nr:hypothetical protein [Pseudomonadota bacterium]